jgi:predicted O-methyltransferase YrrM
MFSLDQFLADLPHLHSWDGGKTWNTGGFGPKEISVLFDIVKNRVGGGARVLETGAGLSTVLFLCAGAVKVTSVAPDAALFERIEMFCGTKDYDYSRLEKIIAFSEDALPLVADAADKQNLKFDVTLIDGGHGWPTVFVDFCYSFRCLRKGGFLIIDDIQIYSVKELARMLMEDQNFRLVERLQKTLVFEKTSDRRYLPDFGGQPYVKRKMEEDYACNISFFLYVSAYGRFFFAKHIILVD